MATKVNAASAVPNAATQGSMISNPTWATWLQQANEQAANMMESGNLNSKTPITSFDPIYGKLMEMIGWTMYRRIQYTQRYRDIGRTAPPEEYPTILRELIMKPRKGQNFAWDEGTTPTTLGSYDIYRDEIDVRYHGAQFRWFYPWTVFDQVLKRFAKENGRAIMIGELAEMQMINAFNARNLFMDMLRKQTLYTLAQNSQSFVTGIDITDPSITAAQAQNWLLTVKGLLYELEDGTSKYNGNGYYMQTPLSDLQIVMTARAYDNVVSKAFPDTYHPDFFQNILPQNRILINTFGGTVYETTGTGESAVTKPVAVTYDNHGMSLLNYDPATNTMAPDDPTIQAVIFHRDCLGFEDNLDTVLFAEKDIYKLATPAAMHFWTKAYFTDLLPCVVVRSENVG